MKRFELSVWWTDSSAISISGSQSGTPMFGALIQYTVTKKSLAKSPYLAEDAVILKLEVGVTVGNPNNMCGSRRTVSVNFEDISSLMRVP